MRRIIVLKEKNKDNGRMIITIKCDCRVCTEKTIKLKLMYNSTCFIFLLKVCYQVVLLLQKSVWYQGSSSDLLLVRQEKSFVLNSDWWDTFDIERLNLSCYFILINQKFKIESLVARLQPKKQLTLLCSQKNYTLNSNICTIIHYDFAGMQINSKSNACK